MSRDKIRTPAERAPYSQGELENGADAVCSHGSTPKEFAPALDAFAKLRDR